MGKHRAPWARGVGEGLIVALTWILLPACGGGGGGAGPEGAGQGLVLVNVNVRGLDNVPINQILTFTFSEAVDPTTVMVTDPTSPAYRRGTGSIQIRQGTAFGLSAGGTFAVQGATVQFRPDVPGLCDLSDAGFQAGTTYRVTVMGYPEQFAIRNTQGQPLEATTSLEFTTLDDSDPSYLQDQIPGQGPAVAATEPADGSAAVVVEEGNEVRITFTENLDPCSIDSGSLRFYMAETGDPASFLPAPGGTTSGFSPVADNSPDPFSWGSTLPYTTVAPLQRVPSTIRLEQDFDHTEVIITPLFGRFPENALLVVDMTYNVLDFGGYPLTPTTISFTTENLPPQTSISRIDFERATEPMDDNLTTADIDTDRSPSRAQGWLLFSGDGDNGADDLTPSYPAGPSTCAYRANEDGPDDFDPAGDVLLDTGATPSTCANLVDGSTAVVWEFSSFRIRSGVNVRVVGVNPAIILVRGDVQIDQGGTLWVRGTGAAGSPQSNGQGWNFSGSSPPAATAGGIGVAGGGHGGSCRHKVISYGDDGYAGYGSPDAGVQGGHGAGLGGVAVQTTTSAPGGAAGGGGGGAHGTDGADGLSAENPNATHVAAERSQGGESYGSDKMMTPTAGSGAGAGGYLDHSPWYGNDNGNATGGAGGAGGGFLDLTSGGDIRIHGAINASGGTGGDGIGVASGGNYLMHTGTGGGGGGGGLRLLTPASIDVTGSAISASGGLHGVYPPPPYYQPITVNWGGNGGAGRIVMEDADSVIQGLGSAIVTPGEGSHGFYRGIFDPSRFAGGASVPVAVTGALFVGPLSAPAFQTPVADDFVAGIPAAASRGFDQTSILVEARGYGLRTDGTVDVSSATGWITIGFFKDSGAPQSPTWVAGSNPGDVSIPGDNVGAGIALLDGSKFLQVRVSFFLPATLSPTSPGPWVDAWDVRFAHDQ